LGLWCDDFGILIGVGRTKKINSLAKSETGRTQMVSGLTGPSEKIAIRRTMTAHRKKALHPRRDATTEDMRPHIPGQMTRTIERPFTKSVLWKGRFLQVADFLTTREGTGSATACRIVREAPRSLQDVLCSPVSANKP
jgi:hypothetical protein